MVSHSVLRHLLNDDESLTQYHNGLNVDFADIRRRLLVRERSENRKIPDHYYRLQLENELTGIVSLPDLLRKGMTRLADTNLEVRGRRIYVRRQQQNAWQHLLTYIPPLVLQTALLYHKLPIRDFSRDSIVEYKRDILLPNFRYTALPFPYLAHLEHYIENENGLLDLHMHLNGATETDIAWQDHLFMPKQAFDEIRIGFGNEKVKEQFAQESHLLEPNKYFDLLNLARSIRELLFDMTVSRASRLPEEITNKTMFAYLTAGNGRENYSGSYRHPFNDLAGGDMSRRHVLMDEAIMYLVVFSYLASEPRDAVASLFHCYLLILGLCNRLLVQQVHQYGFEQFQKHTLNGLRESSEKMYRNRFFQIQGNDLRNLSFLEGRFSPKEDEGKTASLLLAIKSGWQALTEHIQLENVERQLPALKLTAHFIKRPEKSDEYVRFRSLRVDTWKRAKALSLFCKNQPTLAQDIVGIDGAASEFDTPPEVFAPAFRMLRRKNFRHFTFHAGEDFFHIVGGMRAVYESVMFLGLHDTDRIGHATALGLDVQQWVDIIGPTLHIRQGQWLDDLLFVNHMFRNSNDVRLLGRLPSIVNEIQQVAWDIHKRHYAIADLESAWLYRRFCPIMVFSSSIEDARKNITFDYDEWAEIQEFGINSSSEPYRILAHYHSKVARPAYDKIVTIEVASVLDVQEMRLIQMQVLSFLHQKDIAIETLPTSNVRIGYHPDYSTYHLWNWMRWEEEGHPIPAIVLGTDDTGIFATNIYNEFANIYCQLTNTKGMSHNRAMDIVRKINENSKIYRFQ